MCKKISNESFAKNNEKNAYRTTKSRIAGYSSTLLKGVGLLSIVLLLLSAGVAGQTTKTSITTTGTWTCPAGVTKATIEVWGAGGAGGSANAKSNGNDIAAGGAASGAYVKQNALSLTVGTVYTVTVGLGGIATNAATFTNNQQEPTGGASWFNNTSSIYATGGAGGSSSFDLGTKASSSAGIGTATGCLPLAYATSGVSGSNGNQSNPNGGAGGTAPFGGNGGSAQYSYGGGKSGSAPSGGGGGALAGGSATSTQQGGTGARGEVDITYYVVPTISAIAPTSLIAGNIVTVTGTNFYSGVSTVTVNGMPVTTNYVSSTSLTATLPTSTTVGTAVIGVSNTGVYGTSTASTTFNLTVAAPVAVGLGINTVGASTWTCPAGVTAVTIEAWGGGGAGGSANGTSSSVDAEGGGGASGAYVKKSAYTVTPNSVYNIFIGSGGNATTASTFADNVQVTSGIGESASTGSWFNSATTIYASGGTAGYAAYTQSSSRSAAQGCPGGVGSSTGCLPSSGATITAGNSGATGQTTTNNWGGAGASAPNGSINGGAGGAQNPTKNSAGFAGTTPGGGGSGAYSTGITYQGGAGGNGQVIVTYYSVPTVSAISPTNINVGNGAFTITVTGTNFFTGVSQITWNGTPITTTFGSSTSLTATVPATSVDTAGTVSVGIINTGANGTSTCISTQTFTVNKIAPTIGVFTVAAQTYGASTFNLTAPTSNSNGAFSYTSSNTSVATISGTTVTVVGAGTATITATQATSTNYLSGSTTATLTVGKAVLNISAIALTANYGTAVSTVTAAGTYIVSGLVNGDLSSIIAGTVSYTTNYTATTSAGTAGVIITPVVTGLSATNYTLSAASGAITVVAIAPTIGSFTVAAKNYGDAAFTLTAPTTNSAGAFNYTSSNTSVATISGSTVTIVGAGTSTITANQAANGNYTAGSTTATLTVSTIAPTLTGFAVAAKNYGDAAFTLTAPTTNSAGAFTYTSSNTSVATISGSTVTIVGAGTSTITANQAANGNYTSGTATTTLTINKAVLTITADAQSVAYGTTTATVTGAGSYTATGFVNGENASLISGSATYTTTYTATTAVGASSVIITPVTTALTAANYSFNATNGTVTVIKANSTITATGTTTYTYTGSAQGPATNTKTGSTGTVTYSYSGTGSTSYTTSSTKPTNAGTYQVIATVASNTSYNSASSSPLAFTINKANSNITGAPTASGITYGQTLASSTLSGGTVSGSLAGTFSFTTPSTTPSVGTASQSVTFTPTSSNYNTSTTNVNVTVSKASSIITATGTTTFTYTGTAQGPTSSNVTGSTGLVTYSYSGTGSTSYSATATKPTSAGTYQVIATVAADANYNSATSSALAFTINKAILTVTADNKTVIQGAAIPSLTATISGYVNSESSSVISGSPLLSTLYTPATLQSAGPTAINAAIGMLAASNYSFSFVAGSISISCVPGTWTGVVSSDYSNTGNWCGGILPNSSTDVIVIATAPNAPVIAGPLTTNNLIVPVGAVMTVTGTLNINGSINNSGTINATAGNIVMNGSSAQTIPANTFTGNIVKNLEINNAAGVTLSGALTVTGTVTPTLGTLNTGGNLILKSDSISTARIGIGSGNYINGSVTIQRYIPAKSARRYSFIGSVISAPIRNSWQQQIYITGRGTGGTPCGNTLGNGGSTDKYNSNGFDATITNASSMTTYSGPIVSGSHWVSIANTQNTNLTPGIGYKVNVRGDRNSAIVSCADQLTSSNPTAPQGVTLSATGTIITGDLTVALNDTSLSKYTLLANPYPSQISYATFASQNQKINNKMWVYSPFGNGNYATYSQGIIANAALGYDNSNGQSIASGQAFFVEATANGAVTFKENVKTNGAIPNVKYFGTTNNKLIRVGFRNTNDELLDEVVFRFNSAGSSTYNSTWDAATFNAANQVLATLKGANRLAISTLPDSTKTDTAKLGVKSIVAGTFKLTFSDFSGIDSNTSIILKDNFLGVVRRINERSEYHFNITSDVNSKGDNRFALVFKKVNSSTLPVRFTGIVATKNKTNNEVKWSIAQQVNIKKYIVERSLDAKNFTEIANVEASNSSIYAVTDANVPVNSADVYYRVRVVEKNEFNTYSSIVQVKQSIMAGVVNAYPNPLTGKTLLISLNNCNAGKYLVTIYNGIGQLIFNQEITHQSVNNVYTLILNKDLAAGIYNLKIQSATSNQALYFTKLSVQN